MTFGSNLHTARMQAGVSRESLAAELGVTRRTIENYEKGKSFPPIDLLPKIAKYFGIKVEALITEDEEFVAEAYKQGGSRSAKDAKALVDEATALFAGGRLSEDDKDAVMKAIQNAYWIAKEEGKTKYRKGRR